MNAVRTYFMRIYRFYRDGFAGMTVGRSLWILILIKAVLFLVLKLFFFPDIVKDKSRDSGESPDAVVRTELMNRSTID